jgi:ribosomal protein S18 acetylase RimI-like enzyme
VSVRDAELHTSSLWASVESHQLGDWVLRTDVAPVGRLRRRANSCLAMGDPGLPFAEAAAAARSFYEERQRTPYAQVELGSAEEHAFSAAGWQVDPTGDAEHRLASLTQVRRRLRGTVGGMAELTSDGARAVATIEDGATTWARGEAAVDGDWLGVHAVEVDPGHRRQGLARAVMAELLEWGAEQGATTVWLHVETSNAPARALYDDLGLAVHHLVRYLRSAARG